MNPLSMIGKAVGRAFGYDALERKGRRKSAPTQIKREDETLRGGKRRRLQATANEVAKNFAVLNWAIRRHLDYVARFDFHCRTKDKDFNHLVEGLMQIQSRPVNMDRGGRCAREKFFRLLEARRVLDGDVGALMLSDGSVQGIESDLIRQPEPVEKYASDAHEWVDGVEVDYAGFPRRYALHRREKGQGYKFAKNVAAENLILYGFFERFASDQVRGVSPITSALNHFQDVKENIDYALIKAKIAQLWALALKRGEDAEPLNETFPPAGVQSEANAVDSPKDQRPREIDLSNGPTVFDLFPDESVEVVESKNPSMELQAFSRLVLMIGLKAIDIPYSFFDESHTNYSGSRGSWLQYERAALDKRDDQLEARRRWTVFQLRRWILEGWLTLPPGMTVGDIDFEWVPLGMPWWKPSEEIIGDLKAAASGLGSLQRISKERGSGDIFDNIDENLEVFKYAYDKGMEVMGVPLVLNLDAGPFPIAQPEAPAQPTPGGN